MTNVLHYRGDVTDIDTTTYIGADRFGAFYQPTSATYDREADLTTVQLKPIADIRTYAAENGHEANSEAQKRLIELFGGRWKK